MDPAPAIEIRDLRVDYGDCVAVDDISLVIPRGEVFGLIGPNGAGKTSAIKVLVTLLEPTYGDVTMMGLDLMEQTDQVREILGYMPDMAPVPSDLKLWEFLSFHADTHRLGTRRERLKRVDECLEIVNMLDHKKAWCKELSRGQTQRLVLAKTLLHRPSVLILDEPASGLDALSRRDLRLALQRLAEEGATVLVSSHILSELAEMCSLMCVMNHGKLLSTGTVADVHDALSGPSRVLTATTLESASPLGEWLTQQEHISEVSVAERTAVFSFAGGVQEQAGLLARVVSAGLGVVSFQEERSSFEEILLRIAGGQKTHE
ncbi:MAG: ABC-2 type transport system ATP-binding protein [Rhodothermales bacterium]